MTSSQPPAPLPAESADLFDYALLRDYLRFVCGAFLRHRQLAGVVFGSVVLSSLLGLWALPWTYQAETRILAQRNEVMPALGNPGRAVPRDADAPTRAASETVLRRDNLVSLIKQTNLIDNWFATRAPLYRVKDFVFRVLFGPPLEEDKLDALVEVLEKRLKVEVSEGTVTIRITWPDARMAYQLVEAAQQNFLETRHAAEVSTIAEAISILEGHATNVHDSIEATLEEIQKVRQGRSGEAREVRRASNARRSSAEEQELAQVKVMLQAKRRALNDLEEFRHRRLVELQGHLAEQKATFGAAHPNIINIEQSIEALSRESPQIGALKREVQELSGEFKRRAGKSAELDVAETSAETRLRPIPEEAQVYRKAASELSDDQTISYAQARLRMAISKYEDFLDRIDGARIELDTARAAFKYRYTVLRPAQVPKKPESPKVPVVVLGALLAGLSMAVFAAAAVDLRTKVIIDAWQIERHLELPVLAKVSNG